MDNQEICNRIEAVCKALDNISVIGIQNASNIAGCYAILNEMVLKLREETKEDNSAV